MSIRLERLLSLLSDNVWHNVDEVTEIMDIPQDRLQQLIRFLADADLIQYNYATNQVRINQDWKTLYANQKTQVQGNSEEMAVGTIIIPPQKTLIIQCTRITNLTDASLELEVRIDKKLREIAISKVK